MAQVVLENIYKTYPGDRGSEVVAVEDVNLTIEDREFVVLVGPSGCGKSTTLRMVAGLEEISRGNIYIGGKRMNEVPPKDRDIAMVFQNYALYPHMTVYRNMAFGLELRKYPRTEIDRRVQEAAQILGFNEEMLQRKPKALSGGQRQRAALGRAIVRKPEAFLFDEPLSNLDAKMRVQMRIEISKLHRQLACTMIYVTHDQVEAMTMGDRIVVMKSGRIQQVAAPLELYLNPVNAFVASFIGSPAMNLIEGTIRRQDDGLGFFPDAEPGAVPAQGLPLDGLHEKKMASFVEKRVILGIRPENIEVRSTDEGSAARGVWSAQLEIVEQMGSESFFHFRHGSKILIARLGGQQIEKSGRPFQVRPEMSKSNFFAAADPAPFSTPEGGLDLDGWRTQCRRIV
jgi:multiple sugar transport system ATP-binding protein